MKKSKLLMLFVLSSFFSFAQSIVSADFTQIPCNYDGEITVVTTGFAYPLTIEYYIGGYLQAEHENINQDTDVLGGIPFSIANYAWIRVEDVNGVVQTQSLTYQAHFQFSISAPNPVCPETMTTLVATETSGNSTGPFNFEWVNNDTEEVFQGNNIQVPLGQYSGTIEDVSSGCVLDYADTAFYVSQLSNVTGVVNTTQASCTDGTATVVPSGGVAPYTYLWENGETGATITDLIPQNYEVTITDSEGCESSYVNGTVQQNTTLEIQHTVTNATCEENDGSAIAFATGGTPPFDFQWSNGQTGANANGLLKGWYQVYVTDANGCSKMQSLYINATTPINVTYTQTSSDCVEPTGSATIYPTGGTEPYSISWNTSTNDVTTTINEVPKGNYQFIVTDAVGCVRHGTVSVASSSVLNGSLSASQVVCPNNTGNINTEVYGSNPPFSYLWSNGATTSSISNVPLGSYSCQITDSEGCVITKSKNLSSVSPLNIGMSLQHVTCEFNEDGTANAIVTGGTPPYTYSFNNGQTASTATNLGMGNYTVTVTDANGCSESKFFTIQNLQTTTDCFCTIEGSVYADVNENCTNDGEEGLGNIMVHCSGIGYKFTNANGFYSFNVPSGSYTISQQVQDYFPLANCQDQSIDVSVVAANGCVSQVDFANTIVEVNDLKITTVSSGIPPVPGNNYQQKIVVTNSGTVLQDDIQFAYEHDEQIPFASSTELNFAETAIPNNYNVSTGFADLNPGQSKVILVNFSTPTDIPSGTVLSFFDSVSHVGPIETGWLQDETPWNNVKQYYPTVVSSYDPNYKEVYPKGEGEEGVISFDVQSFDYTIHFQNEGTYYAQNIYITDQLDEDLDWTSFTPGYSDYEYTVEINETGLVTFTFPNINLPWKSQFGDQLSSGLVNYSIKRKQDLPLGTQFHNTADIFFDYNPPITTNTTVNTLDSSLNVAEQVSLFDESELLFSVYPNPAKGNVNFKIENVASSQSATLLIYDLAGKICKTEKLSLTNGSNIWNTELSDLMTGNYFVNIRLENGIILQKKLILFK